MEFTMLGSGAVRDNPNRGGPAQMLRFDDRIWMFDCGRSASTNLAKAGIGCEEVDRLFLTHLHFDHIVDFPYIVFVGWVKERAHRLQVYGPSGTKKFAERIIRPPFEVDIRSRLGHGKDIEPLDPEVTDIQNAGRVLDQDGVKVDSVFVDHGGIPTLTYRIDTADHRVIITGDGTPDDDFPDFCRDADLMVIECSGTREFLNTVPWGTWHIVPSDIARIASEATVKRVMIKHLVIEDFTKDPNTVHEMADEIRAGFDGEVMVGEDGMRVAL